MSAELKNTVFRDNIRDNRLIRVPPKVRAIIDTAVFQRLRSIKQMGLSSRVFPTAEHSRFSHSIGVYATACELFSILKNKATDLTTEVPAMQLDDEAERAFCAAAMCHDLGHTAYSHVLESVLLPRDMTRHEDCTLALLLSDHELRTWVNRYTGDIEAVILLIKGRHPNRALTKLISGPLDVDRADYLLRDSQAAGVHYGKYDLSWLMHSMLLDVNRLHQPILMLDGPRGMDALRQFLSGRRYMYRNVYLHPTIRSAQILLKNIFQRVSEGFADSRLISRSPEGLKGLLTGKGISLDDFKRTTDVEIDHFVNLVADAARDPILKNLAETFKRRLFPKAIIDSGRSDRPLEKSWGIVQAESAQLRLWIGDVRKESDVLETCRDLVADELQQAGQPRDLANYLVYHERKAFLPERLTGLKLKFGESIVAFESVRHEEAGYNAHRMMESFELYRLFAPKKYRDALQVKLRVN